MSEGGSFYVVWPDGRRFGPATVDVLAQWAAEQRIQPDTLLEDVVTGKQVAASASGLLLFEHPQTLEEPPPARKTDYQLYQSVEQIPAQQFEIPEELPLTTGSPYPAQSYYDKRKSDLSTAWGLIFGGFALLFVSICCTYAFPGSFALTGIGIHYANKAKKSGDPGGQAAFVTGIVVLCVEVLVVAAAAVLFLGIFMSAFRTKP